MAKSRITPNYPSGSEEDKTILRWNISEKEWQLIEYPFEAYANNTKVWLNKPLVLGDDNTNYSYAIEPIRGGYKKIGDTNKRFYSVYSVRLNISDILELYNSSGNLVSTIGLSGSNIVFKNSSGNTTHEFSNDGDIKLYFT